MQKILSLVLLASLFAGRLIAGEIANPSRLPPPLAPLPKMPADGSGIYRLSLDLALGAAPLVLLLDVQQGKATRGVGLALHNASVYGPVDASKLMYQDNRITGTVKVEWMPLYGKSKQGQNAIAYQLKPAVTATYTLDAKCDGANGAGVYSAEWDGKAGPLAYPAGPRRTHTLHPSTLELGQIGDHQLHLRPLAGFRRRRRRPALPLRNLQIRWQTP